MCGGASHQQTDTYNQQQAFNAQLQQSYTAAFGASKAILDKLTSIFEPILEAGPGQEGFTAAEKNALNTQATEGVAQNYQHAAQAVNAQMAARGGGNEYLPSGSDEALRQELATSAAAQQSTEQNMITQANYAQGRQNFFNAAGILGGAAAQYNPTGYGGLVNQGLSGQAQTANQISQANNAWMGPVFGMLGGIAGAATSAYGANHF